MNEENKRTHEELVQEVYRMAQMLTYEEQQRIKDKYEKECMCHKN